MVEKAHERVVRSELLDRIADVMKAPDPQDRFIDLELGPAEIASVTPLLEEVVRLAILSKRPGVGIEQSAVQLNVDESTATFVDTITITQGPGRVVIKDLTLTLGNADTRREQPGQLALTKPPTVGEIHLNTAAKIGTSESAIRDQVLGGISTPNEQLLAVLRSQLGARQVPNVDGVRLGIGFSGNKVNLTVSAGPRPPVHVPR